MKVQCDYCNHASASLFCFADEAALCDGCDRKIHRANKVASKHRRFSLVHPLSGQAASQLHPPAPLCDIC
ncbi:B-box zinc finger family protein [Rhynchospora pubera]|uniref:B-box zinc finger family protein n=1 Tax=Rhynchospora pubera TaxID=906938 RepID=A0AAV8G973_9POAL|nr:B-box zinc finger family protein [Rhynchospora pubera]